VGFCGGVVGCSFDYYFLIDLGKREKEKEKIIFKWVRDRVLRMM